MKLVEKETYYHYDVYQPEIYYTLAVRFSIDIHPKCTNYCIECKKYTKEHRQYLSSLLKFKVTESDNLVLWLKRK